jgi:hypothetical protein
MLVEKAGSDLPQWLREKKLPWLSFSEATRTYDFVIDNHLLSTYRACPDAFFLQNVEGYHKRGITSEATRNWFLEFGILFHKMIETYYKTYKMPEFQIAEWAGGQLYALWHEMKMDVFLQEPELKNMGGLLGIGGLFALYATRFSAENEKLRIIGTEVAFGKNHEVCLHEDYIMRIFLSGRMDIICDDGYFIQPMDHKTMGRFQGDPLDKFLIDEGPTGYIFALNSILKTLVPEELILKRSCNRILMNLISKSTPKDAPADRLRRLPIYKSTFQLEQYRIRQVITCENLLDDVMRYSMGIPLRRDTDRCTNWFRGKCPFFDVHRQADKSSEEATLRNGYVKLPLWDTETVGTTD